LKFQQNKAELEKTKLELERVKAEKRRACEVCKLSDRKTVDLFESSVKSFEGTSAN